MADELLDEAASAELAVEEAAPLDAVPLPAPLGIPLPSGGPPDPPIPPIALAFATPPTSVKVAAGLIV